MENKIQISDKIKAVANIYLSDVEVMLFGSRARQDSHDDSDYDILIITKHTILPEEKTPYRTNIRKDLLKEGIRSDILIQSKGEINKKKKLPGHIIRNILREAILL